VRAAAPPVAVDLAGDERAQRRALYHLGADLYRDLVLRRAAEGGDAVRTRALLAQAAASRPLEFPLKGRDVAALGVPAGPEIGRLLAAVAQGWEDGDFRADRKAALAELKRRLGKD
jgi:poly(A) polymerase